MANSRRFFIDFCLAQQRCNIIPDLPAFAAADAVLHGKVLSFLGLKIVFLMGIHGRDDIFTIIFPDLIYHVRDDGDSFGSSEGAIDEIILHIDNDQ